MSMQRNRRWFTHLLSLVLLCAQLGLVAHASTHMGEEGDAPVAQVCDYCVSSSALQHAAGGGTPFEFAVTVSRDSAVDAREAIEPARAGFTAFRSRAPPRFL
jgi:hypothetical protein